MLVFEGIDGIGAPVIGGGNPEAMGEADGFEILEFVAELSAGSGQEGIDSGFVDGGGFLITFALDSPIVAGGSAGNEIDAGVFAAEIAAGGEIIPEPDMGKEIGVTRIGVEVSQDKAFEFVAFVTFGERVFSKFGQNGLKSD